MYYRFAGSFLGPDCPNSIFSHNKLLSHFNSPKEWMPADKICGYPSLMDFDDLVTSKETY